MTTTELLDQILYGLNQVPNKSFTDKNGKRSDTYALAALVGQELRKLWELEEGPQVLRILDLDDNYVPQGLKSFLIAYDCQSWIDTAENIGEDIFHPDQDILIAKVGADLDENTGLYYMENGESINPDEVLKPLAEIKALCDKHECGYFRITHI